MKQRNISGLGQKRKMVFDDADNYRDIPERINGWFEQLIDMFKGLGGLIHK